MPSTAPVAMAMRTRKPHMMMDWGSTCTYPTSSGTDRERDHISVRVSGTISLR